MGGGWGDDREVGGGGGECGGGGEKKAGVGGVGGGGCGGEGAGGPGRPRALGGYDARRRAASRSIAGRPAGSAAGVGTAGATMSSVEEIRWAALPFVSVTSNGAKMLACWAGAWSGG